MNMVKAPGVNRSLPCTRGPVKRPASNHASMKQKCCTCYSVPRLRETSVTDKALAGAAATLLSFSAFACQPALADLNKFEAAAGGEFNVGTAAQYGEAELRGKDFSGQVILVLRTYRQNKYLRFGSATPCHNQLYQVEHCCRTSGGRTSLPQMPATQISRAPNSKGLTSLKLSRQMPILRLAFKLCTCIGYSCSAIQQA